MEEWKDIPGFNGMYQVSTLGRVRSWKRHQGRPGKREIPLILKQSKSTSGYLKVNLWSDGVRQTGYIHQIVAEEFVDNSNCRSMINHIDGNKENNYPDNLEWVNASENLLHAYENDLRPRGNRTKKQSRILKSDLLSSDSELEEICEKHNITMQYAKRIIKGEYLVSV